MSIEITVVIPIKDEHDPYIDQCLESLQRQNYHGTFEVIVIEGGNRAQARNLGVKQARGKIIAFIDADCVASTNWLSLLANTLGQDKTLGGVGGINFSPSQVPCLSTAIDFVFSSYIGSLGSASLGGPSKPKLVNGLACINSAYWSNILREIGGFDEEFELCEDTNLSYKVRRAGYSLLFDPNIHVWHHRRDTIRRFAKQFYSYGVGRMRSILTNKAYATKGVVIPFAAVVIFPFVAWFFPLLGVIMILLYFGAVFVKGFQGASKKNTARFLLLVPCLFIVEHISYLFGMIDGLARGRWKRAVGCCQQFRRLIVTENEVESL